MYRLPAYCRPRRAFPFRPPAGILAMATALLLLVVTFAPASAEVAVEVTQIGWNGFAVSGSWNPVRVRVTGDGAGADVRVEVVAITRQQSGPQGTFVEYATGAYGQEVALPAGVTKEVTIWIPAESNSPQIGRAGLVRVTSGGRLLVEQRVEFQVSKTPFWPLIGVLADSQVPARAISQLELPYQGLPIPLTVATLSPADLPASAERLGALSALVVQGSAPATLTNDQRRAVQDWVSAGGHLVLSGGPQAARAAGVLPPDAVPVTFATADSATDLEPLARWAGVQQGEPLKGPATSFQAGMGSALAGTGTKPLAWRLGMGRGTVTLLAVDPALEPLASWSGTPTLLRKALEPALPGPDDNEKMRYIRAQGNDVPSRLQGAVDALPAGVFPSWQDVALLLGGFALLAGPLLHLLLWRADRRGWLWLAIPPAALLVAVGMYYFGIGRGGKDVITNIVAHLQIDPEGNRAQEWLVAGFYAPTHQDLDVYVPSDAPVRVLKYTPAMYGSGMPSTSFNVEPPFHVIGGRDTRVEFPSGQWGMRSVAVSRTLGPEVGKVTARLALDGGMLRGTIRNDTPYPLEDAAVLVGQSLTKLGNLAPGQTAQAVLDPGAGANPFRGGRPLSWLLFGRKPAAGSTGGPGYAVAQSVPVQPASRSYAPVAPVPMEPMEIPQDPEIQRRVRLMDPVINAPRSGPGNPMMPLTFIAFTRATVGKELPAAGDHPTYQLTLLEQPLRLEFDPGPFTLPPALLPAEISEQTGGLSSGGDGTITWFQLMGGSMTFTFRPPLPARAEVDALVITTRQIGTSMPWGLGKPHPVPGPSTPPRPAEAGLFSVYNWQSAAWEPLPGNQDQVRLEPAARYVGPDGTVKLQARTESDRSVQLLVPDLAVEGRVVQ